MRLQSSVEFLLTYAWAFMAISIFLAFLLAVVTTSSPESFNTASCYISPEFTCISSLFSTNAVSSKFIVLFINNVGQPIAFPNNALTVIPSFTTRNYSGYCLPYNALKGATITCTAIIGSKISQAGSQINPKFNINYELCSPTCAYPVVSSNTINTTGYATLQVSPNVQNPINNVTLLTNPTSGQVFINGIGYPNNNVYIFLSNYQYNIYGQPPSGYVFGNWVATGGVTVASTSTQSTTAKASAVGTLTVNFVTTTSSTSTTTASTTTTSSTSSSSTSTSSVTTTTSTSSTSTTSSSTSTSTSSTSTTSIHYVAITLTNSGSATPAAYQQLVVVNSNTYSAYINSQWNNVEFTTGAGATGTVLNAWVQTNAINTATYTMVWVKIPAGVGAGTSTIYMDFMPSNIMSSSGPTGEASELSTTYGQYDNGGTVFAHYDSFIGSSLNATKWTVYALQGMASAPGLVTVSNSLHLNFGSTWWGADAYSNANFATTNGMALDYQFDWAAQSSVSNCSSTYCDSPGEVYLRNTGAGRDTTYYAEPGCPDVDIAVNIHNSVSTLSTCNGSVASATASIAPSVGTWYPASLQLIPTSGGAGNAYFYFNGASSPTISVAIPSSAYYPNSPLVIEYHTGNYNSGDQFFIRDSRLRVAVATPPTTSFGSVV